MNVTVSEAEYIAARAALEADPQQILLLEEHYMALLANAIAPIADIIAADFNNPAELYAFWINYPPLDRGRAPTGESIPWQEVGETVIGPHIVRSLTTRHPAFTYPGLPSGADLRFRSVDALIHLDIKVTGPNDVAAEIVASPNQISGDGAGWQNGGMLNTPVTIRGRRQRPMIFQPELAPFYIFQNTPLICLTYFLKAVYTVTRRGHQPLEYIDLLCAPNGLLAFTGPNYNASNPGLFIPGKDRIDAPKKRVRLRTDPLVNLHAWRKRRLWTQ